MAKGICRLEERTNGRLAYALVAECVCLVAGFFLNIFSMQLLKFCMLADYGLRRGPESV